MLKNFSQLFLCVLAGSPLLAQSGSLAPPPAAYEMNESSAFLPLLPKVNVITGEYCEEECDLVVAGIEPLSYRRYYGHLGHKDLAHGHWRVNPECRMSFNFELTKLGNLRFTRLVGVGERNGNFLLYDKISDCRFVFDSTKYPSFTNADLSGQTHPLNHRVSYSKTVRKDTSCLYFGQIEKGDGHKTFFSTRWDFWPRDHVLFGAALAPPYEVMVTSEKLPNGNIIEYSYVDYNEGRESQTYHLLQSITAYDSTRTFTMGSLEVHYTRGKEKYGKPIERIDVVGSDGRKASLFHSLREVQTQTKDRPGLLDNVLREVSAPWKPVQHYQYRWGKPKQYFDAPFLFQSVQGPGRLLETSYDLASKKVTAQSLPLGPNQAMIPVARYEYGDGFTCVFDGEHNKTCFRFNPDKRITAIEKYEGDELCFVQKNTWEQETGNLLRGAIEDGSGRLLRAEEYVYDKNHNAIELKRGDEEDEEVVTRSFSQDGFNLKISESNGYGKLVRYTYVPDTNLLSSEITISQGRICKRAFHFYDSQIASLRVRTIVDDGINADPFDLTGVSYRHILEITPRRSTPCMGFVEELREKTIDANGNEILLKKVQYRYHPSGKVEAEDHFDSEGVYRFSVKFLYDERERLIAQTNPLGQITKFTYDENFQLTSEQGPRSDMRKEWGYDLAGRPVLERVWQRAGECLVTRKKYDRASRLVETIDTCGFETRYVYDALNRVVAIHHPDGGIERKGYDALGNLVLEIDGNGHATRKSYNFRGQVTRVQHPDGACELFSYYPNGTLASHTDRNCATTTYRYDLFDHLIGTDTAGLKRTSAVWSPFSKLSETDEEGITTFYTYDFAGRKMSEKKGERAIFYFYDALGRQNRTQTGDTITIEEFDLLDRVIEKRIEGEGGNLYFQERYCYDESGNKTHVITCAGTTETVYNALNQPIERVTPDGNSTYFSYEHSDHMVKTTTNPKGLQTIEVHDGCGRLIDSLVKNPQGQLLQRTERIYDLAGNQTQTIEHIYQGSEFKGTIVNEWIYGPRGRIEKLIEAGQKETCYLYDGVGRLKTLIKPDGRAIYREYDLLGRLARFYGEGLEYRYSYDCKDRLVQVIDAIHNSVTRRQYDGNDKLTEETLASGITIRKDYDCDGRRAVLHLPDGSQARYIYQGPFLHTIDRNGYVYTYLDRNLAGKPTSLLLPAKLGAIQVSWDASLRQSGVDCPYYRARYKYDSLGNLSESIGEDVNGSWTKTYEYDDLSQLLFENERSYRYDSLYNRIAKDACVYQLNSLCEVTHDGQNSFSYDKNGNLLSDEQVLYEYDLLDRLVAVTKNGTRTTFTYDPFNRRIAKNGDLYLWDDKEEIGMSRHGKVRELRILGEGLGAEIGAAVLFELWGYVYFPIHDLQGSLATMVYTRGYPYGAYRYTAFGEKETPDAYAPWLFASKRLDEETGLIFFGRRYYSPRLGRWMTTDPQGFEDGPNLYAYVHNNPLTHCDLYGLRAAGPGVFLGHMAHAAFGGLEWMAANLFPIPFVQDVVESIGRWGAGGEFRGPSRYRTSSSEVITIPGRVVPGISVTHGNGMLTKRSAAIEQAEFVSHTHGDVQVDLLYHGTKGFLRDLISCGLSKMGMPTDYNTMCANYYRTKLQEDPDHFFFSSVHSRGGIQMMNTGHLLKEEQRKRIHVLSFGSATLIPKGFFMNAENFVNRLDFVAMSNPLAYLVGLCGKEYNMHFLPPATRCPYKAHGFLEETYANEIIRRGDDFKDLYFHE